MGKKTVFILLAERGVEYDQVVRSQKLYIYLMKQHVVAIHNRENDLIEIYKTPSSILYNIMAKLNDTF